MALTFGRPAAGDYGAPYSMETDIGSFGSPAGAPMAAPGMNYGAPLTTAVGNMPTTTGGAATSVAAPGGKFGNFMGGFANLAEGLSGLGQLYIGMKSLGMAKEQLAFSKEAYRTNLGNQTKSYNTELEDRLRARGVTEGRDQAYTDAQIAANRLTSGDARPARR